jgi:hypothetical protein
MTDAGSQSCKTVCGVPNTLCDQAITLPVKPLYALRTTRMFILTCAKHPCGITVRLTSLQDSEVYSIVVYHHEWVEPSTGQRVIIYAVFSTTGFIVLLTSNI